MSAPTISAKALDEFLAAYRQCVAEGFAPDGVPVGTGRASASAEAGRRLGMSLNASGRRKRDLKEAGRLAEPARTDTFTPPDLPAANEPVHDMVRRRIAAFARKREAAKAREWMQFRVEEDAPFLLAFVGDPHADDDGTDLGLLERHLDLIQATPGAWAIGMGDWLNSWIGRLGRLYGEQGTSTTEAWQFADWMLNRPIWMLLLRGNHDMWNGSSDPLKWISRQGLAPLVDWRAQFTVACGGASWRIHAAHDFPGNSMWNRLHAPLKRAKMTGHNADLYIAGHRHTFALAEDQDEHSGRVAWLARCKGYKALDSYAYVLGYGQAQDRGQSIAAVCDPRSGKMQCFSDLDEAAAWLTWLRRPRVRVPSGRAT